MDQTRPQQGQGPARAELHEASFNGFSPPFPNVRGKLMVG
jgi:hypothetical protein